MRRRNGENSSLSLIVVSAVSGGAIPLFDRSGRGAVLRPDEGALTD